MVRRREGRQGRAVDQADGAAKAPAGRGQGHLRLLAREGEAAHAADQASSTARATRSAASRCSSRAAVRRLGRRPRRKIAKGTLKPVAWSPASSLWGRLLNFEADRPLAPDEQPVDRAHAAGDRDVGADGARRSGYPQKKIGFDRRPRARRVRDRAGRSSAGPSSATFKLVHTNPDFSTSGLSAVVAEYYAATGQEGGADREATSPRRRPASRCATSSARSSTTATPRCSSPTSCARRGRATRRAVAMEEVTLLDFNRTAAVAAEAGRALSRRRARSTPTTRSSRSTRRG